MSQQERDDWNFSQLAPQPKCDPNALAEPDYLGVSRGLQNLGSQAMVEWNDLTQGNVTAAVSKYEAFNLGLASKVLPIFQPGLPPGVNVARTCRVA